MTDVTQILVRLEQGDPSAAEQLLPLVYDELRKLAASKLANEKPGQTLQATALVHDAYLRLAVNEGVEWNSRGHFFSAAAEAMRRILIEQARRKNSQKGGGDFQRIEMSRIDQLEGGEPAEADQLLALDEALEKLRQQNPRKAKLVMLRYFGALTIEQAAKVLAIAPSTAIADWAYAKGWLKIEMSKDL